jgi:RNA polymerase sigma-70 factor (ECF subfamily)
VWESIQKLTPTLREAIILRHWGELTYREMAEVLGCPIRTAQSRVRLAHESLQALLDNPAAIGGLEKVDVS